MNFRQRTEYEIVVIATKWHKCQAILLMGWFLTPLPEMYLTTWKVYSSPQILVVEDFITQQPHKRLVSVS
jgi:hypothetical protein